MQDSHHSLLGMVDLEEHLSLGIINKRNERNERNKHTKKEIFKFHHLPGHLVRICD
jgi:hypothetical protein